MSVPVDSEVVEPQGEAGLRRAELPSWRSQFGLVAGITTRHAAFNLGLASREASAMVTDRWHALHRVFSPQFPGIAVSRQPHGAELVEHRTGFRGCLLLDGYDGHATAEAGILLTVTVADCVPVYLAHPGTGAIALLHAGWRGIVAGVLERGIEHLTHVTGAPADALIMHSGVAIGGARYEVGPGVLEQLGMSAADTTHVDLREVLARRAQAAGIRRLTVSSWCTHRHEEQFWSHRRDAAAAGRMIAYLGRPLT